MFPTPQNTFVMVENSNAQNLPFLRLYNKNNKRRAQPVPISKKPGRPKTPDHQKARISVNVYLTQNDYLEIKNHAKKLNYKSLSRLVKDTVLVAATEKGNIDRLVNTEHEAYKSYASALDQQIEEVFFVLGNIPVPDELLREINRLNKVIQQFLKRLQQ